MAAPEGITFAAVTFSQVVEALRSQCADYDAILLAMVDDYELFLTEEGLIEEQSRRLIIFPCGASFADNARFGLYYEGANKPTRRTSQYLGVYRDRQVIYIGKIVTIAACAYQDGKVSGVNTPDFGELTAEQTERVREAAETIQYHDLKAYPLRYFFVDHFAPTLIQKATPGGVRSVQYLDLVDLTKNKAMSKFDPRASYSIAEVAEMLKGTTFG